MSSPLSEYEAQRQARIDFIRNAIAAIGLSAAANELHATVRRVQKVAMLQHPSR